MINVGSISCTQIGNNVLLCMLVGFFFVSGTILYAYAENTGEEASDLVDVLFEWIYAAFDSIKEFSGAIWYFIEHDLLKLTELDKEDIQQDTEDIQQDTEDTILNEQPVFETADAPLNPHPVYENLGRGYDTDNHLILLAADGSICEGICNPYFEDVQRIRDGSSSIFSILDLVEYKAWPDRSIWLNETVEWDLLLWNDGRVTPNITITDQHNNQINVEIGESDNRHGEDIARLHTFDTAETYRWHMPEHPHVWGIITVFSNSDNDAQNTPGSSSMPISTTTEHVPTDPNPVYEDHGRGWSTDNHIIQLDSSRNRDCGTDDSDVCFNYKVREYYERGERSSYTPLELIIEKKWPHRSVYMGETVKWGFMDRLDWKSTPPITITDADGITTDVAVGTSDNRGQEITRLHTFDTEGTYRWHMSDYPHIGGIITVFTNSDNTQNTPGSSSIPISTTIEHVPKNQHPVYENHGRGWSTDNHIIQLDSSGSWGCWNDDDKVCFSYSVRNYYEDGEEYDEILDIIIGKGWPDRSVYIGETVEWDLYLQRDGVTPNITITDQHNNQFNVEIGESDNRGQEKARLHTFDTAGTYRWYMPDHPHIWGVITVFSNSDNDAQNTPGSSSIPISTTEYVPTDPHPVYENHGRGWNTDNHIIQFASSRGGSCGTDDRDVCFSSGVRKYYEHGEQSGYTPLELIIEKNWPHRSVYTNETVEWDYRSGRMITPRITITDTDGITTDVAVGESDNRWREVKRLHTFDTAGTYRWHISDHPHIWGVITVFSNSDNDAQNTPGSSSIPISTTEYVPTDPHPVYENHGRGWNTDNHIIQFASSRGGSCGTDDRDVCFSSGVRKYYEHGEQSGYTPLELIIEKKWPHRSVYTNETVEWDYRSGRMITPRITITDTDGITTDVAVGESDNRHEEDIARLHTFDTAGTYRWHISDHPHIWGVITVFSSSDNAPNTPGSSSMPISTITEHIPIDPHPVYEDHGRGWSTDNHVILFNSPRSGSCGTDDSDVCFSSGVRKYYEHGEQSGYTPLELITEKRWPHRSVYANETVEWDLVAILGGKITPRITITDADSITTDVAVGESDNRHEEDIARLHTFDTAGTYRWHMPDYPHVWGVITVFPDPQEESSKSNDVDAPEHASTGNDTSSTAPPPTPGSQSSQQPQQQSPPTSQPSSPPTSSSQSSQQPQHETGALGQTASTTTVTDPKTVTVTTPTPPAQSAPTPTQDEAEFTFHWEIDKDSISGYTHSASVNKPLEVEFLNEDVVVPDHSFALVLQHDYGILLSNENMEWNNVHAFALVETLRTIPQDTRDSYSTQNLALSKWILHPDHITDDIKITPKGSQNIVTISIDAFDNANPKMAEIDGKQGQYFSQRLHHALVLYVTDYGKDSAAVEKILNERYGVSTKIDDYASLTKHTTSESAVDFQKFHHAELVKIINMFEEMPSGFHSIVGLDNIVRRADGTINLLHPSAPAVAWTKSGYIEFMDTAFTSNDRDVHRLIIHEKSHFMWYWLFSQSLKQDWINLGGWYQDVDSVWHTTKTTEFVSSYAHLKNPNEDMAESISSFIINPDKLKSRSDAKYEFIRDRVMQGDYYISKIREDLTFDVYNLYPDYVYPGKIISVDVSVSGKPYDDKTLIVEINLDADGVIEGGTKHAYMRIFSEIGTFVDMYLYPVDDTLGSVLQGEITLDQSVYQGYWYVNQITVTDIQGNQRFEGQNDFGWMMYVENADSDSVPPEYVPRTLELELYHDSERYSRLVQIMTVSWEVLEDRYVDSCLARIDHESSETYHMDSYGIFDENTSRCIVEFVITEYHISGNYHVTMLVMDDMAENRAYVKRSDLTDNVMHIKTANQDVTPPYLDINDIQIHAEPTNPDMPNGETLVEITYNAYDDKSGLDMVNYVLVDPQGLEHFEYHYHDNFYTVFFKGDPASLVEYEIVTVLPEGSPPGKWGLAEMTLADKATNKKSYSFTEIIHFEVNK